MPREMCVSVYNLYLWLGVGVGMHSCIFVVVLFFPFF